MNPETGLDHHGNSEVRLVLVSVQWLVGGGVVEGRIVGGCRVRGCGQQRTVLCVGGGGKAWFTII